MDWWQYFSIIKGKVKNHGNIFSFWETFHDQVVDLLLFRRKFFCTFGAKNNVSTFTIRLRGQFWRDFFFCILLTRFWHLKMHLSLFLCKLKRLQNRALSHNPQLVLKTVNHRDKTRVQMPAKMFPHLKLLCWVFMGPLLVLTQSKETVFWSNLVFFNNKSKILTILLIV